MNKITHFIGVLIIGTVLAYGVAILVEDRKIEYNNSIAYHGFLYEQRTRYEKGLKPSVYCPNYYEYGTWTWEVMDSDAYFDLVFNIGILLAICFGAWVINANKYILIASILFTICISYG